MQYDASDVECDEMPAGDVYSLFYYPEEKDGVLAVLYKTFLDDSADGTRQKYVIAAGLIGDNDKWNSFRRRWKRVREQPPKIKWFHSKEWMSLTGQFFQFCDNVKYPKPKGREAANAKREALKRVIESSGLVAVGVAVLVEDFNLVTAADPRAAEYLGKDPYDGALQSLVFECARALESKVPGSYISYVSDDSDKAEHYTAVYTGFKQKNPKIARMMRGLAHLDDKIWPGLQAADLVAHVTNQVYKTVLKLPVGERGLLESIPELESNFYLIAHWDKWYMCHILNDTIGLDLFDKLGIDRRRNKSYEEIDAEKEKRERERSVRTLQSNNAEANPSSAQQDQGEIGSGKGSEA